MTIVIYFSLNLVLAVLSQKYWIKPKSFEEFMDWRNTAFMLVALTLGVPVVAIGAISVIVLAGLAFLQVLFED